MMMILLALTCNLPAIALAVGGTLLGLNDHVGAGITFGVFSFLSIVRSFTSKDENKK